MPSLGLFHLSVWGIGFAWGLGELKTCDDEAIGDPEIEVQLPELKRRFLLADAEETRV